MLECANDSLKTLTLDEVNLLLGVSTSISILLWLMALKNIEVLELKRNNVFANSLLDATI